MVIGSYGYCFIMVNNRSPTQSRWLVASIASNPRKLAERRFLGGKGVKDGQIMAALFGALENFHVMMMLGFVTYLRLRKIR